MMKPWHQRVQDCFRPDIEVPFDNVDTGGTKPRRADAIVVEVNAKDNDVDIHGDKDDGAHERRPQQQQHVLEFQHSYISSKEVAARENDYALHGKRVTWVVDGNGPGTDVRYLDASSTYMIIFRDVWKYAAFVHADREHVYLERGGMVYRFAPRDVRCSMIDVRRPVAWEPDFVQAVKTGRLSTIWDDTPLPQSSLYHVQRGAGNGKTHDSIQLIASDVGCLGRKTTFLYVTKAHTAKSVICDELRGQNARGKLQAAVVPGSLVEHRSGKHIFFEFDRTTDGARVRVIVGTIDSFMYAMGDKEASKKAGGDMFDALRESIKTGHRAYDERSGCVRYAQRDVRLNKECMLVVDEAQDLPPNYIEAIAIIQRGTYVDVYVIGDKLQSIWSADNVFTYLEREGLPHTDKHVLGGPNVVRRFHRQRFIDVVNSITPFHLFEHPGHPLPPVSAVCNGCDKYAWAHAGDQENDVNYGDDAPLRLFDADQLGDARNNVAQAAETLTEMVAAEVARHAYLPENIMFIFPFIGRSLLAACLETRLTNFWLTKFAEPEYRRRAKLGEHPYWSSRLDDGEFYNYAFLHKSEENRPINLDESTYSTRLLSIHASKGQGCEVVYLVEFSEDALKYYCRGEVNLMYESLLHVAVTRHKVALRVVFPPGNDDDIRRRFARLATEEDEGEKNGGGGRILNDKIRASDVVTLACSDRHWCARLNEAYFLPSRLHDLLPSSSSTQPNGNIVEWGHHIVRHTTLRYTVLCEIARTTGDARQVDAIVSDIIRARATPLRHREYYQALRRINDENNKATGSGNDNTDGPTAPLAKDLPILEYDDDTSRHSSMYARHRDTFVAYVRAVQKKLADARRRRWGAEGDDKNGNKQRRVVTPLPTLCPVEACVFSYAQEVLRDGIYSTIKAADVYKILDAVRKAGGVRHAGHDCMCGSVHAHAHHDDEKQKKDESKRSVSNVDHFDALQHVKPMFASFLSHIVRRLGEDEKDLKFNVDHFVSYSGRTGDFTIWDKLPFVVHGKHNVVIVTLHPTFGALSSHVDFTQALVQMFVTAHPPADTKNVERFAGKRVLVCFFTFTCSAPVWIDLGKGANFDALRECMAHAIARRYRTSNAALLAAVGKACREEVDPRNAFERVDATISEQLPPKATLPKYMTDFLACIKRDARKRGRVDDALTKLGLRDTTATDATRTTAEELEDTMRLSIEDWISVTL